MDAERSKPTGRREYRFRHIGRQAVAHTSPSYRVILQAYAQGVNEGLAALGAAPIEYFVLGTSPEPWQVEDTILTGLAMFNTLQGRQGLFEDDIRHARRHARARDADFLTARGSEWDAPMTGG